MDGVFFLLSVHLRQQLFKFWSGLQSALEVSFCVLWKEVKNKQIKITLSAFTSQKKDKPSPKEEKSTKKGEINEE